MTLNLEHNFFTGNNYGVEDHLGDYGAEQYSSQAHNGSGLWGHVADHLGYGSGHDPNQLGQHPSQIDGGQQYNENGGDWNGDYNGGEWNGDYDGGEWNTGDGQNPEEWDGDYHMDPDGGSHHFLKCDDHHDQQGVYHHTAQGSYQNNPQGGMNQDTQHVIHHVVHHDAQNGYHNYPQGGERWDDGYQHGPQGDQEWDDGYDQGDGVYGAQWNGQPTNNDHPGHYSEEDHNAPGAHPGGQYAPPEPAPVSPSPHTEDSGQQAPTGNNIVSQSEHPQDGGQHAASGHAAAIPSTYPQGGTDGFHIELKNTTTSSNVYAYITGQAIDHGNALFILGSDGQTAYYPPNPSGPNTPLSEDCGINLGNPGNTVAVTIPHIAGGRIWFAIDAPLKFQLNPGPALMEPSVTNESDPNFTTNWGFCELTFSQEQLYANISYVDFVSIPISLELTTEHGGTQTVSGMAPNGLDEVCDALQSQHTADGKGWDQLVVTHNGRNLRALSPNQGMVGTPALFSNYYDEYINQVWERLSKEPISVDTQAAAGTLSGHVSNEVLNFGSVTLTKPSTHDIFTCSTGPFQTGSDAETNAIIPRIGAAFNRSTLLTNTEFPEPPSEQYKDQVTNHYSRIVHKANLDGKGYAFPYDDVQKTGGPDQSGEVHASDPKVLTVTVGGGGATRVGPSH